MEWLFGPAWPVLAGFVALYLPVVVFAVVAGAFTAVVLAWWVLCLCGMVRHAALLGGSADRKTWEQRASCLVAYSAVATLITVVGSRVLWSTGGEGESISAVVVAVWMLFVSIAVATLLVRAASYGYRTYRRVAYLRGIEARVTNRADPVVRKLLARYAAQEEGRA